MANDGFTIRETESKLIEAPQEVKASLQKCINDFPKFLMPNTLDEEIYLTLVIKGPMLEINSEEDTILELNLMESIADIDLSKKNGYVLNIKEQLFGDDEMEMKFDTVKDRDCVGVILMMWQGYLLSYMKDKRPLVQMNKKEMLGDPLSLFTKTRDPLQYYYNYKDYKGHLIENETNNKIQVECWDRLQNYGHLESRNEFLEQENRKYEMELESFNKQLYELKNSRDLLEEERFFLIKEVERLVDLERE